MLSDTELTAMQALVRETVMPDTILVTRATGHTIDPSTGNLTSDAVTTVYHGKAHVRVPDSYELDILFSDVERTKQRFICTFPADTTAAEIPQHDDVLVMETGPPAHIGQPFRVVAVTGGSYSLGYRIALEAVT